MDEAIFLIQGAKQFVLRPRPYENEGLLQKVLANHPEVLAGGTTEGREAGQLLLIKREMGIPTSEGGGNTFTLDHLFLDQEGVPVVVEVKRSSDTRIRREVVGQMFDYAANAVRYWPISQLRENLVKLKKDEDDPAGAADQAVEDLIGGDEVEDFWNDVETNLKAGRIRMIFVADEIPDELARVIEFLNEQMNPAEVLGVEVPQYLGDDGIQVLVPRLVGATKAAADIKHPGDLPYWTRESFLEVASQRSGAKVVAFFKRLFNHVDQRGAKLSWGRWTNPGVAGWYEVNGASRPVWNASTGTDGSNSHPYLYFYFRALSQHSPDHLSKMLTQLEQIESYKSGLATAQEVDFQGKGGRPTISIDLLASSVSDGNNLIGAVEQLIDP